MFKKLLSGLFGAGGNDATSNNAPAAEPVEHNGFLIISEPAQQSGQYRVSGWIRRPLTGDGEEEADEVFEHRFERSDMVPDREACDELMIRKARRFIDETGDDMFAR
ncbi:HlyU family transcriptional regulator [Halomonas halodenitrificans]|uniref:HlyU family transcriptional regulator n=1 Tax=Halomonas halodenitrificans TaxID=28252 RepID=UPI000488A9AF|nr:HlyU family transcriptional regulator [Halomonas halodenitrificans]